MQQRQQLHVMKENVAYWVEMASYDYDTAIAMQKTGRYLYVGFMCHQTIEKLLKAYWSSVLEEVPLKIHSLSRLAEKTGLDRELSEDFLEVIDLLEPLNIEARYPSYKERLMKSLNRERCEEILSRTNELKQWIESKL